MVFRVIFAMYKINFILKLTEKNTKKIIISHKGTRIVKDGED